MFIGVDVGTRSARAGVFNAAGRLLGSGRAGISLHLGAGGIAEQSSAEIWAAVAGSVREAMGAAGVAPGAVRGIGFDATCSLVVLGPGGAPLPVGPSGEGGRDIIVWMDHRARGEAEEINALGHRVLDYVGGRISPEMQTPKLLWLSRHRPDSFANAWQFLDLADFLTWRATGSLVRSLCTLTCKWTYLGHEGRWDPDYFRAIGLGALADEGFSRIGTEAVPPGTPLGGGLTAEAAGALGLVPGIAVGAGLIDAHAGGVGTVGARLVGDGAPTRRLVEDGALTRRMAYVFGTSACTMSSTEAPVFVPGVWGPYFGAMVPGLWLNEGGQSAAGAGIDHLVACHPAAPEARALADAEGLSLPDWLAARAGAGAGEDLSRAALGAEGVHVVPEFLGNRAPFADPGARAVITGLTLDTGIESLVGLYLAGLCGLGYGLRQIIAAQGARGIVTDTIVISGGAGRGALIRQLLADATGVPVAMTRSEEPVLLGAAMLGAVASGRFPHLVAAMADMSEMGEVRAPAQGALADWHGRRFSAFARLQETARAIAAEAGLPPA